MSKVEILCRFPLYNNVLASFPPEWLRPTIPLSFSESLRN
jgi:hypothetical protein